MPNCPACQGEALAERTDRSGVVYDVCPRCRGLWLDSGELSRLLGRPAAEGLLDFKQGSRNCVRCAKPMLKGGFVSPALIVDRCAPCDSIWLDASELRVVRQLLGVQQPVDAEQAAPPSCAVSTSSPQPPSIPPSPAQPSGAAPTTPPLGSWQYHGGFWLLLGVGSLVFGKLRYSEWRVLTEAGGSAGPAPTHLLAVGAVLALVGLGFLITQPEHASDGYLVILKALLTPRRRRYFGRGSNSWYNNN